MVAVNLNTTKNGLDLEKLKNYILKKIPLGFNRHSSSKEVKLEQEKTKIIDKLLKEKGVYQLGTLGGGNHFIEIGESEKDKSIWIVIHSGSRGFGHSVNSLYERGLC